MPGIVPIALAVAWLAALAGLVRAVYREDRAERYRALNAAFLAGRAKGIVESLGGL